MRSRFSSLRTTAGPLRRRMILLSLFLWTAASFRTAAARNVLSYADDDRAQQGGAPPPSHGEIDRNVVEFRDWLFMAFRFGLFVFIICFPCLRAVRVWFLAGGRILWRRTESGWIVGLRYQPADLDRWLLLSGYTTVHHHNQGTDGVGGSGSSRIARKLTPEEVRALPEIPAPKPPDQDGQREDDDDDDDEKSDGDDVETGAAATVVQEVRHVDDVDDDDRTDDDDTDDDDIDIDDEAVSDSDEPPLFTTTTLSTSCSICIDDFEEGEPVRLLPRCGHAFHTDCILPWLTERQGCCPYCKTPAVVCPPATTTTAPEEESAAAAIREESRRRRALAVAFGDTDTVARIDDGRIRETPTPLTPLRRYPYNPFGRPNPRR